MTPEELYQYLRPDLPRLIASAFLVPVLQSVASRLWQMRRQARLASIRKEITELDTFIAAQRTRVRDTETDELIRVAERDRMALVASLRSASSPNRWREKAASALLLNKPPYFLSLIMRGWLVGAIFIGARALWHGRPLWLWLCLLIGSCWWYWLTNTVDKVTGPITKRARWRRITLLYRPSSVPAGIIQAFYWIDGAALLSALALAPLESEDFDAASLSLGATITAFVWWIAVHLDRTGSLSACVAAVGTGGGIE